MMAFESSRVRAEILRAFVIGLTYLPWVQLGIGAEYLVSDRATNQILRFDAEDRSLLGPFVDGEMSTNGGLFLPAAMTFGFDQDLFVTSIDLQTGDGRVLRYDGDTGTFQDVFASGMIGPAGIHFHKSSNSILVGSLGMGLGDSNVIYRFAADGTPIETLEMGPVSGRTGMTSRDDGTLWVSSFAEGATFSGSVLEYDYDPVADTFNFDRVFAESPDLMGANGLAVDSEGDLYAASLFGQKVVKFDVEGETVGGSSVVAQTAYPSGVLLAPDGTLLVTSLGNNNPDDPIYPELFPGAVFQFDAETGVMLGEGPFLVGGQEFEPSAILLRGLAGDFDNDGQLTAADIDSLSAIVRQGTHDSGFDLTSDGVVDANDRAAWLNEKKTFVGDSNLDGEFDTGDLVVVFASGHYEDDIAGNSGWSTGDWNGDSEFDSSDIVAAFEAGAFEQGSQAVIARVPEPATLWAVSSTIPILICFGRRRR